MGRAKIKRELIEDEKKRKTTLVRRKTGLVKKISELSTLCSIKACMIIYEGNSHEIWPNDSNEVEELINLYKKQPLEGRCKRDKTLSDYLKDDQKTKAAEMIKVEKYPTWDSRFDHLSEKELRNLAGVLEKRMEDAKGKVEFLKVQDSNIGSSLSHQEIWDNNPDNLNQSTLWPIDFFQPSIPTNSIMDNGLLTIDDYQFGNVDYFMMIEGENWLADNNGIGSSLTIMQNNGISSSSMMVNNGIGSGSMMQPMACNGIGTMEPMANTGIGSSLTIMQNNGIDTMQPMDEYPFIYNDMPYGFL